MSSVLSVDSDILSSIMAAYKIVLIRHGESNWNQENRFCGWFDADLSATGEKEARRGGQALKGEKHINFHSSSAVMCLTSCRPMHGHHCITASASHRLLSESGIYNLCRRASCHVFMQLHYSTMPQLERPHMRMYIFLKRKCSYVTI